MLIAFAPIIVGALIAVGAGYYWRLGRELRTNGVTTNATVISKRATTGTMGDYIEFTLRFLDNTGNPRVATVKERKLRAGMTREGMSMAVTYLPSRPDIVEIGYRWGKKLQAWVIVLFGLGGVWMVVYGLGLFVGVFEGD